MEMWQNVFFSWLTGRKNRVVINGVSSSWGNVTIAIPQGFYIRIVVTIDLYQRY